MDDYIAYALVLIALPWPAQPTWRFGRAYHRTVTGAALLCAALTATHGRTGQVS
jgi:hypothetical protein